MFYEILTRSKEEFIDIDEQTGMMWKNTWTISHSVISQVSLKKHNK